VTPARRLLREPLLHFLIGGALLFALDAWVGSSGDDPSYQVKVDAGSIDRLRQAWQAQSGRPPTPEELAALVEDQVREEIFYREAVRRDLDDGDVLVRRRLAQKLAFLIEDLAEVDEPSDDDLRRFHEEQGERYVEPARVSFRHVFFSRDRRADAAADAAAALPTLRSLEGAAAAAPPRVGDPFMLHSDYAGRTQQEVRELFGPEFADALFALDGAGWQGPVRSSYGEHLVQVVSRAEERMPPFEEVREAVARDFRAERREQANVEAYREMRDRYDVVVEEDQPDREARSGAAE
jgi:parvulin-like peptidyl-prolyl isomerase